MMYPCGLEGYCSAGLNDSDQIVGVFMQLHPTPSGHDRHILRFTTNATYFKRDHAISAMEEILNVPNDGGSNE